MVITWFGHACFSIEQGGYSLILDPYANGSVPGLKKLRGKADKVLCSHDHHDHAGTDGLEISGASCPFEITVLDSYHDEVQGAKRGKNKIHIIKATGCKLAHLGDLGCELTPEQQEALLGLDVMMIPVGGFYTIDAATACKIVEQCKPRIVLPMHYNCKDDNCGYDVLAPVEEFIGLMGQGRKIGSSRMVFEERNEGTEETVEKPEVVVLRPHNREKKWGMFG